MKAHAFRSIVRLPRRQGSPRGSAQSRCVIVVVGAGPAGMVFSWLAAACGCEVTLLEQNATFARDFRGEALQPGTLRIFDDLGIGARIHALDHGAPREIEILAKGKTHRLRLTRPGDESWLLAVPQPLLLEMLAREARAFPNFRLIMGATVKELLEFDGATRGVRYAAPDGSMHDLSADLVVAADGRFSTVRRFAGIAMHDARVPFDLLWFAVDTDREDDRVLVNLDDEHLWASFPTRARRMQVGGLIKKGMYATYRAHGFEALKLEIVQQVHPEIRAYVGGALHSFKDLALLPVVSEIAETWHKPGLLLLGDAAHPMSPVAAQGINVAVQDAVVAARRIVPALKSNAFANATLQRFEAERRPAIARIQRQQNALPHLLERLGPQRAVRAVIFIAEALTRGDKRPAFIQRALDRFLWGDPPIRADHGPWVATLRPSAGRP